MESLHTFTNNASPLATMQVPTGINQNEGVNVKRINKWTFLVANHIRFSDKQANCIHMVKPKQPYLLLWLEKIIAGGQCENLFVEQLSLDEISFKRLKQLCIDYNVALVNLMPNINQKNNVVKGPW
jgi:hypothetical protein